MDKFEIELSAAEKTLVVIRERRPTILRVRDIGVWSTLPYKALVASGGLLWRSEEMGRNAISAIRSADVATGILLTRGVLENTMLLWYLMETIERRSAIGHQRLDEKLMKILFGNKAPASTVSPIHVNDALKGLEKSIPNIREVYDMLSDGSHPNYDGVHGLYAEVDYEAFETHFGNELRTDATREVAAIQLKATLMLLVEAERVLTVEVETWLTELVSLDEPRPAAHPD